MAKSTGLAMTVFSLDDSGGTQRDIRNGVTSLQWATPRAVQDVTGLDVSAMERLPLLADMSMTLTGPHDPAALKTHAVFSDCCSTSVARESTITVNGVTLGVTNLPTFLITDYALNRGQDGSLVFSSPLVLANGAVPTWS